MKTVSARFRLFVLEAQCPRPGALNGVHDGLDHFRGGAPASQVGSVQLGNEGRRCMQRQNNDNVSRTFPPSSSSSQPEPNGTDGTHPGLGDGGEDGPADHAAVGVEPQVIQQQAGGQQHGRGVRRVAVSDALPGVPGALRTEERVESFTEQHVGMRQR